jgi:hypothetical protein
MWITNLLIMKTLGWSKNNRQMTWTALRWSVIPVNETDCTLNAGAKMLLHTPGCSLAMKSWGSFWLGLTNYKTKSPCQVLTKFDPPVKIPRIQIKYYQNIIFKMFTLQSPIEWAHYFLCPLAKLNREIIGFVIKGSLVWSSGKLIFLCDN